jgi:hypothetical protein
MLVKFGYIFGTGAIFHFFNISLFEYDLLQLRNRSIEFQTATPSCCDVMLILVNVGCIFYAGAIFYSIFGSLFAYDLL